MMPVGHGAGSRNDMLLTNASTHETRPVAGVRPWKKGDIMSASGAARAKTPRANVRGTIETTILQVAEENNRKLPPLADDLPLLDSGLDSLCLAVIVARLEDVLGVDPFSTGEDTAFPVTIGDFVTLYENALR